VCLCGSDRLVSASGPWHPGRACECSDQRGGYGMHWPELDEDIGIEGLLLGRQSTEGAASFERWLQRRQAR
jgi:hypothetical protein